MELKPYVLIIKSFPYPTDYQCRSKWKLSMKTFILLMRLNPANRTQDQQQPRNAATF